MNATEASHALTVLLVDDHAVVREGYRRLLERQGNIAVVAEAATADEAERLFLQHAPSVVVMDIALPGISGIEALRRLRRHAPDARVIMFSMYDEAIYADRCLRAGACGYVTKASAPNVLVEAVHAVAEGRRYLSPDIAQSLALRQGVTNDPLSALSAREFEVLRRLVDGQTVKDIAEQLELNAKTVANLQSILRQKLGAENALQLVRQGELLLRGARGDAIE